MTPTPPAVSNSPPPPPAAETTRVRIVVAAARLLAEGGREALSTRAVCTAAGVQGPTIYRLFGDKQGLLDAVAAHGFNTYLASMTDREAGDDSLAELRTGWDLHVSFGLANPYLYSLIYGGGQPGAAPPAAVAAAGVLGGYVHRIARAGRLRVAEDRATRLMLAAGSGTTLALISMSSEDRDPALSVMSREAVIAAIIGGTPSPAPAGPVAAAVALRARLEQLPALSALERDLLGEWLERIAGA